MYEQTRSVLYPGETIRQAKDTSMRFNVTEAEAFRMAGAIGFSRLLRKPKTKKKKEQVND